MKSLSLTGSEGVTRWGHRVGQADTGWGKPHPYISQMRPLRSPGDFPSEALPLLSCPGTGDAFLGL